MNRKQSIEGLEQKIRQLEKENAALRQSEERLQLLSSITENMSDSVVATNANFEISYMNKKAEELFGYRLEELQGQSPDIFNAEPTAHEIQTRLYETVQAGNVYCGKHLNKRRNGTKFLCEFKVFPLLTDKGETYSYVGIQRDITEKKRAEEALAKSEETLRAMLDASPMAAVLLDKNGIILDSNEEHANRLKTKRDKILGKCLWYLLPESVREHRKAQVESVFETGVPFSGQDKRVRIWNEYHIRPAIRNNQNEIEAIIVEALDITDRKRFEEELRFQALLLDQISDRITATDPDGNISYVNRAVTIATQRRREELIGQNVRIFGEDASRGATQQEIISNTLEKGNWSGEVINYRPDGSEMLMQSRTQLLRDESGTPIGMIGISTDITAQKAAEKALQESRKKYQQLVELSPSLIAVHRNGIFIFVNNAGAKLLGAETPEQIVGRSVIEFISPSHRDISSDRLKRLMENGDHSQIYEQKICRLDGQERLFEVAGLPFPIEGENAVLIIATDITFRREKETEYSKVLDTAIDGFWVIDKSGRLLEANPAATAMLGYTQQEMKDLTINDIDVLEDPDTTRQRIESIIERGFARFETIHKRKDGSLVDVEVSTSFLPVGEGKFIAFTRDISVRKKFERENQIHKLRVEISRMMATLPDAGEKEICDFVLERMLDLSMSQIGFLGYINEGEQTMQIHSWSSNAMAQCKIQDKPIFFPIDQAGLRGEPIRQRQPIIVNNYEAPHLAKKGYPEGHVKISRFMAVPVFDEDRIVAVAAVGNKADRYEGFDARQLVRLMDNWWEQIRRKRMIAQEEKVQARLQSIQKIEAIGTLAGGIAHDFNNILFPIIGLSEILMDDLPPGSVEYENAREIFKAGKRGSDLVKQILTFSRQAEHKLMPVRLQKVLKDVLRMMRSTIPSNIKINQKIQSDCGFIIADPTQIHQVAMNLVTNAYHAVEPTNGEISVTLKEANLVNGDLVTADLDPGRYAEITVSDTGCGIDPGLADKIFEPYFTTKEQGKGTGLGLSVVHGIVKHFNGGIKVDSQVGVGTTFTVYFPLSVDQEDRASTETSGSFPTGTERILLVDDEEAVTKLEKKILERLGYRVTELTNSLEALKTFIAGPSEFDLVVSDMAMPYMTGDQLARELIAIRPDIPIIMCTGFSEKIDAQKAESIGVRGFLMKPIVKSEMAKTVRKVLDEAKGTSHD